MAPLSALFVSLVLAVSALANPVVYVRDSPITIPISKSVNMTGTLNLLARDQARARALFHNVMARKGTVSTRQVTPITVDNAAVIYLANVQVGSPATTFTLLIDTGSSNTWVGSGTTFQTTTTSVNTNNAVAVSYGSGSFSGTEFLDRVDLGSGLVIPQQSIGVASTSQGFGGVDGILGIGPVALTAGTVAKTKTVPTVTDNLFASKLIGSNMIGIGFNPTTSVNNVPNGKISFGGVDTTAINSPVTFTPITSTFPASEFWGIDQTVTMGTTTILAKTAGIVDTGTTLMLLASDAFSAYQKATGAVMDQNVGLLRLTTAQFANLKPLNFVINGVTFAFSPNAQAWPRNLNAAIGGVTNAVYLIVADLGSTSGQGFDFVNGYVFLERFYSVYDTANQQVGFATTPATTT